MNDWPDTVSLTSSPSRKRSGPPCHPQSGQLCTGASRLWAGGKGLPQLHQGQRGVTEGGC